MPGWPLTHYIAQTDLESAILLLQSPPSLAPLLGAQVCVTTTLAPKEPFISFYVLLFLLKSSVSVWFFFFQKCS